MNPYLAEGLRSRVRGGAAVGNGTTLPTSRTQSQDVAHYPHGAAIDDPLAGEDELWAAEDFLWTPDEEDYFGFLRTLLIALVLCTLVWLAVGVGAVQLFELATG